MSAVTKGHLAQPHRPNAARTIATVRAGAAIAWAVAFLLALHGRRILGDADVPVLTGLLVAAYPMIDALAAVSEARGGAVYPRFMTGVLLDGAASVVLLIATFGFHAQAVLIVFGAWAFASGLLQLAGAWRSDRSRQRTLPLIVSGAISAVAGISFIALSTQHTEAFTSLSGYAILGAVFFLMWTALNRRESA